MKERPLISIIIPAYNIEDYLDKCMESVCNQTYTNIEIILINDGSTDGTPQKCQKWADKDTRIKYVSIPKSGVSEARNLGMSLATADFIGFVDSDDHIASDMFEALYENMIKYDSDISICGVYWEMPDGEIKQGSGNFKNEQLWDSVEALKLLIPDKKINNYLWDKLFKRKVFKDVVFPKNRLYEDISVMFWLFNNAKKISHIGSAKYYYHQRKGSIVNSISLNAKKERDYFDAKIEQIESTITLIFRKRRNYF